MSVPAQPYTFDRLVARAGALAGAGPRQLLGIAGAPGAGKSTLAQRLVAALGPVAALVPMDGFHLAEAELHRLGRHHRKGALDTFDGAGYVALMRRLRTGGESGDGAGGTVYAPEFRRELEESIAGAIAVPPQVRLVVTEGNYLLVPAPPWGELRGLLDEVWFLDLEAGERLRRLTDRHIGFGRSVTEAATRARGTDQVNADLIETTVDRSDVVVRLAG
ncbi:hypothetical protein BDK92_2802 [Micromonospora pisi]|uniref:Pantothenate kinase n=1 Tax=Micromonospora pisi TaxID=589240 RepID=A0A495JJB0_9ACTN|nr:nucleoside/nucleotide kinase family protein [Micromonospora pisi]RKR88474.1 hypothetical protein BDK92_2802 [Micromonospora pisi]